MWKTERAPLPDCPNCGKKEGANMGSTEWRHDISCCSNECGEAIRVKLEDNRNSVEYKNAIDEYRKAKEKVMAIKYKGINAIGFSDQIGDRMNW